jgi:hypothetical protein
VLLLKNERLMVGEVERIGDHYRVARASGATWVPRAEVLRVCADLEDAYAFVQGRANLNDPDERMRLAQWCRRNGMQEQALAEVRATLQLRPDHEQAKRLARLLVNLLRSPHPKSPSPPEPEAPLPEVDVTAETLGAFVTRVQPILMNACFRCHTSGRGGQFQLRRIHGHGQVNRHSTQRNLAAVLAQVNPQQPGLSLLLTKAISDHAHTGQAPLHHRKDPPYQALEEWIRSTLANNPQLARQLVIPPALPVMSPPSEKPGPGLTWGATRNMVREKPAGNAPVVPRPLPLLPEEKPGPAPASIRPVSHEQEKSARSDDPYDPEEFNRRHRK